MSKGKIFSKLNIFKKKKRFSRHALRSNSTREGHNNMETVPEIIRGNTLPVTSRNLVESNLYKRKNLSISSTEDIDNKKKQPYLGPDQASSSNYRIPTPAPSATTSSISYNNLSTVPETNQKDKHRSLSPVSMSGKEKEPEASTSESLNNPKDEKMKDVEQDSEIEESTEEFPKNINSINSNDNDHPSTSNAFSINEKNKNIDTPPHTPTIFVTSKSTVSSIVGAYEGKDNSNTEENGDAKENEIKSQVDAFDMYVEDVFNNLALDAKLVTESVTEENPNRHSRVSTEPCIPGEPLSIESLTPTHSSHHLENISSQPQTTVPSSLNIVQTNDETPVVESNTNAVNTFNANSKKEIYNNDVIKKTNENKKDKMIDEDSSSKRDKENKTNDNKAKNNDIEKYLEKENTHTVVESMDLLNNTIEMMKCGICLDILLNPKIVEPCGHSFCNHCLRLLQVRVCPLCRTRINDYHSSIILNELSELIAKYSLNEEQLEERNQCLHEIEEKDKHLNDECLRLMELMELAHHPENTNNYSVQFNEIIELNETDDDI